MDDSIVTEQTTPENYPGLFVVFEGGEGSGKSTQARKLAEAMGEAGIPRILTREPGNTLLGSELRNLLLSKNRAPESNKAELFLFAADRAEHVHAVVRPALRRGEMVICDRYKASTLAYQAYANGLSWNQVKRISNFASGGLEPNITFFLDIPAEIGLRRAKVVRATRFEDKPVEYHIRVREGFLRQRTDSWITLDGTESPDKLHDTIRSHVMKMYLERLILGADEDSFGRVQNGIQA